MSNEKCDTIKLLRASTIFSNLTDEELSEVEKLFTLFTIQKNAWIYKKGDQTNGFFIMKSGEASVYSGNLESLNQEVILICGDFFGEEAVFLDKKRNSSVRITAEGEVLFISQKDLHSVLEKYPEVLINIGILVDSRKLSARVQMPWLAKDEYVQVITRKHPVLLLAGMSLPITIFSVIFLLYLSLLQSFSDNSQLLLYILLIGFGISVLWLIWNIINWANDYYIITNKRMVWVEKVAGFYDSRQEAPLSTLLTVGTRKTRLGNILGYADVIVRTFVGSIQFRNVKHAKEISHVIESYWERIKESELIDESDAMRETLKTKIGVSGENDFMPVKAAVISESEKAIKEVKELNFFQWLFSDFLKVRYDVGGTTVYRKHWFTLLKGTFLPLILFILSALFTGAVVTNNLVIFSRIPALVLAWMLVIGSFLWLLYQYADWRNDVFQLTNDQVIDIDRKPLGKERRRTAPLENILSIEYARKGFFAIIFNYGTVYISIGNTKLTFDNVYNPSEVQQDIFARMGIRIEEKRRITVEQERERVSEWFKVYHQESDTLNKMSQDETRKMGKNNQ